MARSIETIYQLIIAEKEANTELQGLTSNSSSAIWRLWAWVTATVHYTLEVMMDLFKAEIESILATLKPGTLLWYQEMCKAFQYGDNIVFTNSKYLYETIDEDKKIIKQCSVTEGNKGLVIKIAKEENDELVPLSSAEHDAFEAYVRLMKYAGTRISIVNSEANKLHVVLTVYYDPLILAADGTDITESNYPVVEAIEAYLRALPFNGRLKKSALLAAILAVEGVYDANITLLEQKYGVYSYQTIAVSHVPETGYFKIDQSYPLSGSITYTPNV